MTAAQTRTKEWLMEYCKSEEMITALEQQLKRQDWLLKEAELYMNESDAEEVRKKTAEIKQEIAEHIRKLVKDREIISQAIQKIEDTTFRTVLTKRFLCGKTNEETAKEMYYDIRTVQRKVKKAYGMLEIPEDLKGDTYAE